MVGWGIGRVHAVYRAITRLYGEGNKCTFILRLTWDEWFTGFGPLKICGVSDRGRYGAPFLLKDQIKVPRSVFVVLIHIER